MGVFASFPHRGEAHGSSLTASPAPAPACPSPPPRRPQGRKQRDQGTPPRAPNRGGVPRVRAGCAAGGGKVAAEVLYDAKASADAINDGAHKLMEDHIYKLKTPAKIDAA